MRRNILLALGTALLSCGATRGVDHVPADQSAMKGVRAITTRSRDKNHVALVNVGSAVPAHEWGLVPAYAAGRLQVNVWTNSIATLDRDLLFNSPDAVQRICGPKARVAVFIVDGGPGPAFLAAPGRWSIVNVRSIRKDSPNDQTLRDRYAKFLLKGLAMAGGAGVSLNRDCAMFYNSFTLEGMDKTGITICPMSYFPMLETLQAVGGPEMLDAEDPSEQEAAAQGTK